jgi:hypothetical protein
MERLVSFVLNEADCHIIFLPRRDLPFLAMVAFWFWQHRVLVVMDLQALI